MSEIIAQESQYLHQTMMRHVREYYDLRLQVVFRARPAFRGIVEDVTYLIMTNVGRVLAGSRPFGGDRLTICQMVFGDDTLKRRALLNPTDQITMLNEIVEKEDEKKAKTAGMTAITSIRSLYAHLDASFDRMIETIQSFIWIDLPDVFDLSIVDVSTNYIGQILKARGVPETLAPCFNHSLRRALTDPVSVEDALLLYYHRMKRGVASFAHRLSEAKPYAIVIRREGAAGSSQDEVNQTIMGCAQHLANLGNLQRAGQLAPETAQAYARMIGVAPDQINLERVVAWENAQLAEKKKTLGDRLATASAGGQPVDLKVVQLQDIQRRLESLSQHLTQAGINLEKEPPKPREDR